MNPTAFYPQITQSYTDFLHIKHRTSTIKSARWTDSFLGERCRGRYARRRVTGCNFSGALSEPVATYFFLLPCEAPLQLCTKRAQYDWAFLLTDRNQVLRPLACLHKA